MKDRSFTRIAIALAALWAAPYTAAQTPVNSFTVEEVGFAGYIYCLNNAGHFAGAHWPDGLTMQACLVEDGVTTDLGTLGGYESSARGINNWNQVVGWSTLIGEEDTHAFLWDPFTGMKDLGTLGGQVSLAAAINDAGQVVGTSNTAAGLACAFLWKNDHMIALPPPAGYIQSQAFGINASGQVVGTVNDANSGSRPFRWTPAVPNGTTGTMVLLEASPYSQGRGINIAGHVVGSNAGQAALWTGAGGPVTLVPGPSGAANSINDIGTVVGSSSFPFVWDPVHGTRDLNKVTDLPAGLTLHYAVAVNASGQILADQAEYASFLLTPSPLPSRPYNLRDSGTGGLNLSWDPCYGATIYNVKRWSGSSYAIVATVSATSYRDTTVPNSQANLYVVSAVNSYGESRDSEPAITMPLPPTNLTAARGKGKGTIGLKWTPSTSWGITQYRVYRSTTNGGPYTFRAATGTSSTFMDTGLTSNTTYYYVATAVNTSGRESVYSNQASARPR